jgi:DNA-binding MarR family transcriptional regulator
MEDIDDVLTLNPHLTPKPKPIDRSMAARWTPALAAAPFTPVPAVMLENLQRLRPHDGARGLNCTETMVLLQLLSFKWDVRAPWPSLATIADRLGLKVRTVRATLQRLEELKYVRRERSAYGGTNRFHLDGLFAALEKLLEEQKAATATVAEAADAMGTEVAA